MGPIGEGRALILRVNRNCPWNRCLFCPVYKGRRFSTRNIEDIKRDIDAVRRTWDLMDKTSWVIRFCGMMNGDVIREAIRLHPEIYGHYPQKYTKEQFNAVQSLNDIANWISYGAKRVFLQDADALAMKPTDLVKVLLHLKASFPSVETITCYARSRTCYNRSLEDLESLKDAGTSRDAGRLCPPGSRWLPSLCPACPVEKWIFAGISLKPWIR
jgi:hypothetical protein